MTDVSQKSVGTTAARSRPTRRPWSLVQYLALLGCAFVALEVWTWVSWLADGPAPITQWQDRGAISWYVARVAEVLIVLCAVGVSIKVVRDCRRQRRLTLEAMMVIGGASAVFWDPMVNWLQPSFMYSSQWFNVNTWAGHFPGVPNVNAGMMPEPFFIILTYPFGLVFMAAVLSGLMRVVKARRPRTSAFQLGAFSIATSALVSLAFEAPMFALDLWAMPGAPADFSLLGSAHRLPYVEIVTTAIVFGSLGILHYFRNDEGLALVERGLDHLPGWRRALTSVFATIAYMNLAMLSLVLLQVPTGMHADPYPHYPAHIVNGMCDAGPFKDTRYGPCPGTPGFRIPVNGAVPGPAEDGA